MASVAPYFKKGSGDATVHLAAQTSVLGKLVEILIKVRIPKRAVLRDNQHGKFCLANRLEYGEMVKKHVHKFELLDLVDFDFQKAFA